MTRAAIWRAVEQKVYVSCLGLCGGLSCTNITEQQFKRERLRLNAYKPTRKAFDTPTDYWWPFTPAGLKARIKVCRLLAKPDTVKRKSKARSVTAQGRTRR